MSDASAYLPLLRMSIAMQDHPKIDPNGGEVLKAMDPERAKWLQHAMEDLLSNPIDEMKTAVKKLDPTLNDDASILNGLEVLLSHCENIDLARDLDKIHGFKPTVDLLSYDQNPAIQALSAQLVATVVQNHPETQAVANQLPHCLLALCQLVVSSGNDYLVNKTLFALSSLIRDNDVALKRFVKECKGVSLLVQSMDNTQLATCHRKALSLLTYIFERIPALVCQLTCEHTFPSVCASLEKNGQDVDCRQAGLRFLALYQDKSLPETERKQAIAMVEHLRTVEEEEDMVELCKTLLVHL